jgi:hypothetical protein
VDFFRNVLSPDVLSDSSGQGLKPGIPGVFMSRLKP